MGPVVQGGQSNSCHRKIPLYCRYCSFSGFLQSNILHCVISWCICVIADTESSKTGPNNPSSKNHNMEHWSKGADHVAHHPFSSFAVTSCLTAASITVVRVRPVLTWSRWSEGLLRWPLCHVTKQEKAEALIQDHSLIIYKEEMRNRKSISSLTYQQREWRFRHTLTTTHTSVHWHYFRHTVMYTLSLICVSGAGLSVHLFFISHL